MLENSIKRIVDNKTCTGCSLCFQICGKKAISMNIDAEGFTIPFIDKTVCISCGICLKFCPVNKVNKERFDNYPKLYAMRTNNINLLKKSASGGIFGEIAQYFLENNGAVCAARWNDDYTKVFHDLTEKKDKLEVFLSSKYVQSDMSCIYDKLYKSYKSGKKILFCGTPCQVSAIKKWVQIKEINDIFTCDILCFGVPSPKIYAAYRNYLIKKYNSDIKKLNFRSKKRGWCNYSIYIKFKNNKKYVAGKFNDPYYQGFMGRIMFRHSCYNCKFASMPKQGDITIGDLWGARRGFYNFWGVSVVTVNNSKGNNIVKILSEKQKIKIATIPLESVSLYNKRLINGTTDIPLGRDTFYHDLETEGFELLLEKYLKPKPVFNKLKFMLKHFLRRIFEPTF